MLENKIIQLSKKIVLAAAGIALNLGCAPHIVSSETYRPPAQILITPNKQEIDLKKAEAVLADLLDAYCDYLNVNSTSITCKNDGYECTATAFKGWSCENETISEVKGRCYRDVCSDTVPEHQKMVCKYRDEYECVSQKDIIKTKWEIPRGQCRNIRANSNIYSDNTIWTKVLVDVGSKSVEIGEFYTGKDARDAGTGRARQIVDILNIYCGG